MYLNNAKLISIVCFLINVLSVSLVTYLLTFLKLARRSIVNAQMVSFVRSVSLASRYFLICVWLKSVQISKECAALHALLATFSMDKFAIQ